jgi:putative transposase
VVSSHARREQVAFACERGLSQRRACELLEVARSALSYQSVRAERDAPTIEAMKRLAAQYPRYGYRRIRIFLRREGLHMSRHRAHRLWRLAELQLPRRRRRRRVASSRPRPIPATGANFLWAYDFVFDACANGQSLKCLTIIDEFTRECLAIDVAGSIRSARVIEVLARLISERGAPRYLRSDNGSEFVSKAILEWLENAGVENRLDRSWQTMAKRDGRKLQRPFPRRVPEPGMVSQSSRSTGNHRNMAPALQRGPPTFEPQLPHADRVQTAPRVHQPGSRSKVTNGPRTLGQVTVYCLPLVEPLRWTPRQLRLAEFCNRRSPVPATDLYQRV